MWCYFWILRIHSKLREVSRCQECQGKSALFPVSSASLPPGNLHGRALWGRGFGSVWDLPKVPQTLSLHHLQRAQHMAWAQSGLWNFDMQTNLRVFFVLDQRNNRFQMVTAFPQAKWCFLKQIKEKLKNFRFFCHISLKIKYYPLWKCRTKLVLYISHRWWWINKNTLWNFFIYLIFKFLKISV